MLKYSEIHQKAYELAETYYNGNRSYVLQELCQVAKDHGPITMASLALEIDKVLSDDYKEWTLYGYLRLCMED